MGSKRAREPCFRSRQAPPRRSGDSVDIGVARGRRSANHAEDESGATRIELRISLAKQPEEGDQVVAGGPVFIESEAASFLNDKLLDADVSGNEVQFSLRDQAEANK
jgi:hypothetical protein